MRRTLNLEKRLGEGRGGRRRRAAARLALAGILALAPACRFDDTSNGGGDGAVAPSDAITPGAFPFVAIVSSPTSAITGLATVQYVLFENEGVPVDVEITWLTPATLQSVATPGPGSNLNFGLEATPAGVAFTFVWDSAADFPGDIAGAEICLQATSATGTGDIVCTPPFDLLNAVPGADQVRISEVFTGGVDRVELVNLGTVAVDLQGMTLRWTDESGLAGVLPVPISFVLEPGARTVLVENTGGGAGTIDLIENISWSSATGGSAELLDLVGGSLDFLRWGGSATEPTGSALAWSETEGLPTPPSDGTSLSRVAAEDTNGDADWCLTNGTSGDPNGACLVLDAIGPGDLLIVEISTASFDWVEIVNTSGGTINALGVRLSWSSVLGFGVVVVPDLMLAPGDRFIIADDAGTPGPTVIVGVENFAWAPFARGGTAALLDAYGDGIDFVRWGDTDATGPPPGVGWDESGGLAPVVADTVTLTRNPESVDTDTPDDFCVAEPTFDAPNGPCLAGGSAAELLLTEIAVGGPDWVEVLNAGTTDVDLVGWRVAWSRPPGGGGAMAGSLSLPSYLLAAGERVVVADGDVFLTNQIVFSGGFGQNIAWGSDSGYGGAAVIVDPYGAVDDFLRWGSSTAMTPATTSWSEPGGGIPAPGGDGDRVARDESLGDNDADTDWCVVSPGTPGLPNDPCP